PATPVISILGSPLSSQPSSVASWPSVIRAVVIMYMFARVRANPMAASRESAIRFIVALGTISLFADVTYEGARSVNGPFLGTLGATAFVIGAVSGAGELVGYVLRMGSGVTADRTRRYWLLTIFGYFVNLVAVPFLALPRNWPA